MSGSDEHTQPDDERLNEAILRVTELTDRGQPIDRDKLLAEFADVADDLKQFIDDHQNLRRIAGNEPFDTDAVHSAACAETLTPGASTEDIPRNPELTSDSPDGRLRYFGDFELIEKIAQGGMGVVFKARQVTLNRIVALKMILSGELATAEDRQRFQIEAEAAAKLDHPGIVPIYEVGRHDDRPYLSMGLVEGVSLSAELREGPLPPVNAARIVKRVAEAVQYAHDQGVIHRDIKPGNILIDKQRTPRVTDFGLAKKLKEDDGVTITGQILGTPSYMPPEQAVGRNDEVRETADLYSLGAVLYAALTGRPPFQADNPLDTMRQVLEREPVSPRELNPAVPRDLETICLKCLQKSRRARYHSAQELADDLQRFLQGMPVLARPVGRISRAWRWCRRNPVVAALSALVAISLVAGTVVSTHYRLVAEDRADEAERQEQFARDEADRADHNALQAEIRAEEGLLVAGDGQMLGGDISKARDLYHQAWDLARKLKHPELRATSGLLASYYSAPPPILGTETGNHGIPAFAGHTEWIVGADISYDSQQAISCSLDGTVRVWNLLTGQNTAVLRGHNGPVHCVVFLPDGRHALSGGNNQKLILWDLDTGKPRHFLTGHKGPVTRVAVTPDGKKAVSAARLVVGGQISSEMIFWNLETGKQLRKIPTQPKQRIKALAISPDGRTVVHGGWVWPLRINDLETGRLIRSFTGHRNPVSGAAFSPDGKQLVSCAFDKTVRIWDVQTGRLRQTLPGGTNGFSAVDVSRDGRHFATGSTDGTIRFWRLSDGKLLTTLTGHTTTINAIRFIGESSCILSASEDRTIKLWQLDRHREIVTYLGHRAAIEEVGLSGDGRLVISGGYDKQLHLCDAITGLPLRRLPAHQKTITDVRITRDGRRAFSTSNSAGTLKLWDLRTGQLLHTYRETAPHRCGMSADGTLLVSGSAEPHTRIKLWEPATGREVKELGRHDGWISGVFTDSAGRFVFSTSGDSTLRKWDVQLGKEVDRRSMTGNIFLTGSLADNRPVLMLGTGDGTLILWNHEEENARLNKKRAHGSAIDAVTLDRHARVGVSGGRDNQIKLWDIPQFAEIRRFDAHTARVTGLELDSGGRRFASVSYDKKVHIWDLKRPEESANLVEAARRAVNTLRTNPRDGAAWNSVGNWYAFRRFDQGALACLLRAQKLGAVVSSLTLARCCWHLGRFNEAEQHFESAINRKEAPEFYLRLCKDAVRRAASRR